MSTRERMISFKLLSVQDGSAVIELNILTGANESMTRRVRLRPSEVFGLSFDMTFYGDRVGEISSEVHKLVKKAKHAHI